MTQSAGDDRVTLSAAAVMWNSPREKWRLWVRGGTKTTSLIGEFYVARDAFSDSWTRGPSLGGTGQKRVGKLY